MVSTIVALDLGATHVRGVEAEIRNGKPPKMKKIHQVALDTEILNSGEIVNVEGLTKAITRLFDEAKFKSKYVITFASGEAIETRTLETPWSPEEDFKKLLPHYIREDSILGEKEDEYYFDSHTLNEYFKPETDRDGVPVPSGKQNRMKLILATAVKKTFVDRFIEATEKAGLRPYGVDILPFALIRAQSLNPDIPTNASVVSIEIGGEVTTIVVHKNNQPQYITSAPNIGGVRVTTEIANELGITLAEAELLKISFSVPQEARNELKTHIYYEDGRTQEVSYSNFSRTQKETAVTIVAREVSNLIGYISEIIEDAYSTIPDNTFSILLSGGGAGLHTLLPRVQAETGTPTSIVQSLDTLDDNDAITPDQLSNQHIYTALHGLLVGQNEIK